MEITAEIPAALVLPSEKSVRPDFLTPDASSMGASREANFKSFVTWTGVQIEGHLWLARCMELDSMCNLTTEA